jgi:CDP-6-deoxy-D-xylo-4-hexulose-3-dehydrase
MFANHPRIRIQEETGESSWFGFSMVLREDSGISRAALAGALKAADIECRPIVAGNFLRNPVIRHMPHVVHGTMRAADYIHDHGLFVGNHHYDVTEGLERLKTVIDNAG